MSLGTKRLLVSVLVVLGAGPGQAWAAPVRAPAAAPAARIVRPDSDQHLQWAASVVQIDALRNQGDLTAKLFGTAGGDPAMNGLETWLALFASPQDGWRVFRLGDFLGYRIVSERPGRVTIAFQESVMNADDGTIGTRDGRLLISWTAGAEPPASVRVTPAR